MFETLSYHWCFSWKLMLLRQHMLLRHCLSSTCNWKLCIWIQSKISTTLVILSNQSKTDTKKRSKYKRIHKIQLRVLFFWIENIRGTDNFFSDGWSLISVKKFFLWNRFGQNLQSGSRPWVNLNNSNIVFWNRLQELFCFIF